jgi:photosystem II stability/assembly factor-like uncharacterized protein
MKAISSFFVLVFLIQSLSGQSWIRQNPFPTLAEMQDVHFDGLHGLAVGTESTLLTTSNGGQNWIPRKAPFEGSLFQTALVVPGTNGQLMFAGGYQLIVSRDGGKTWSQTTASTQLVYKIQALPDGTILILDSDHGSSSKDNGVTWQSFSMPGINTSAGHFTNEMNGWVVYGGFENNQVWVTSDGGDSWMLRDPLKHPVVSEIWMTDSLNGYLASRDFVYTTSDGGSTWIKMHDNSVNSIVDMHVVNANEIWTCLNNGFIFYTLDGGDAWDQINPNIISSNRTSGIFASDDGKVWVGGKYVSIMYSSNSGADWTDQVPNAKGIMYEPHFINENLGIIGSSEGTVLKTTNGGASFDKIQFGPDEYFYATQMITEQAVVVGSSSGRIFGSADQGETWSQMGENLGQISDIHAFNLQSAVVTTEFGNIRKTSNGGAQWNEVHTGNPDILLGLDFVDEQKGWACGWFGRILKSEDGGANWTSQRHDGYHQFVDIHFTSDTDGWVVSSNFSDTAWHTTNGGVDWQPSILPYKTYWHKISFTNPDTGWIAGGSAGFGIILRTNNGGQSWTLDHQAPEAFFGLYAIPGKETVWATGLGGNIEKYSPCTFNLSLSGLVGDDTPCERDTATYSVNSSEVDLFEWSFPETWLIYGNPNTSTIQVIVGSMGGEIRVIGKDACGNTTDALTLSSNPIGVPESFITENNGVLTCNLESGFYQWLKDGIPIAGAEEQTYIPTSTGKYEVVVTMFATGCQTRSNSVDVLINSVHPNSYDDLIVHPNPVSDVLYISAAGGSQFSAQAEISLLSFEGRIALAERLQENHLNVTSVPDGVYVLLVHDEGRIMRQKILVRHTK